MDSTCTPTSCRCVGRTLIDRCVAIWQYVRPEDVAHLIKVVPVHSLPRGFTRAAEIAGFIRSCLENGQLRYIPDPRDCDRWGRPSETFRRGGGDCDDLAILAASLCRAMNVPMTVVVGTMCSGRVCDGHAWVEGADEAGGFLIEATNGQLLRHRPVGYNRQYLLTPEGCAAAPEFQRYESQVTAARIHAAVLSGSRRRAA
jgi:hypothetical protein